MIYCEGEKIIILAGANINNSTIRVKFPDGICDEIPMYSLKADNGLVEVIAAIKNANVGRANDRSD